METEDLIRIAAWCRNRFVHVNMPYANRTVREELFSECCLSVVTALQTYDPCFGVKFITYACKSCFWTMKRWLDNESRSHRSSRAAEQAARIERKPSKNEVAAVKAEEVIGLLQGKNNSRLRHIIREIYVNDRLAARVSEDIGISQARVSELKLKALWKLREELRKTNPTWGRDLLDSSPPPRFLKHRPELKEHPYFDNLVRSGASSKIFYLTPAHTYAIL